MVPPAENAAGVTTVVDLLNSSTLVTNAGPVYPPNIAVALFVPTGPPHVPCLAVAKAGSDDQLVPFQLKVVVTFVG